MVVDSEWDQSWYIRDRDCIGGIQASPDELLVIMASEGFWKTGDGRASGPSLRAGAASFLIWIDSLASANKVSEKTLDSFVQEFKNSEISVLQKRTKNIGFGKRGITLSHLYIFSLSWPECQAYLLKISE